MSDTHSFILTDVANDVWLETFDCTPDTTALAGTGDWSIHKRELKGGLSDGVDLIEVDNGALSFSVLPTRGMGIWQGSYHGLNVGWQAPVRGPVHPKFVNPDSIGGLGWLHGFDEMIVRCGLNSNGAPCVDVVPNNMGEPTETQLALHGRIANLPASHVSAMVIAGDVTTLKVTGVIEEAALFCPQYQLTSTVETVVGSNRLTIHDVVTNTKATPAELELLYHCNFGQPFLDGGATLCLPADLVAPRDARATEGIAEYANYLPPTAGFVEQAYWYKPRGDDTGACPAMLRNAAGDRAIVVRFNTHEMPAFTQWKNTAAVSDGYVTGLEPGTDYPNAKTFERQQGRVVVLEPGESYNITFSVDVLDTTDSVDEVTAEIAAIQGDEGIVINPEPLAAYTEI